MPSVRYVPRETPTPERLEGVVHVPVSRQLLAELATWSEPVQVKAVVRDDGSAELLFKTVWR